MLGCSKGTYLLFMDSFDINLYYNKHIMLIKLDK